MEENPKEEVLIARNNETGQVGAVVGQNPDGTPKMADVKSTPLSELVKFTKGQNPLEAFTANFMRQAKNPTTFGIFKMSAGEYEALAEPMAEMLNDPETNKAMLDKYRVEPKAAGKKNTPVDPDLIDWAGIRKDCGLTRDDLEKSGALEQMLYNHKSPQLFNIKANIAGETFDVQARLSFRTNPDGTYSLIPHCLRKEPQLDQEYKGYTFNDADKAELRRTGNLGKVVELADTQTGEVQKSLVSIDRLTNEIVSIPVDNVYIKNKVANIELTGQEIAILKSGGTIREKQVELPNGRKFTADLQYNADKRDVVFISEPYRHRQTQEQAQNGEKQTQKPEQWLDDNGNPKRLKQWCKIPLSEQQQADYLAGKQIFVGEGKDRFGNDCTIYLKFDPQEKKPETTRVYPDRDNVVGIAEEHKTQVSVNNDGKTNEATKNVNEPLSKGQAEPKNEAQQQRQQRKPRTPKP